MEIRERVGIAVTELRARSGMTLNDFARSIGQSGAYVSDLEHGMTDPSLVTLERCADAFQMTLYEFFDFAYREDFTSSQKQRILD